jgi:hypothetical protein
MHHRYKNMVTTQPFPRHMPKKQEIRTVQNAMLDFCSTNNATVQVRVRTDGDLESPWLALKDIHDFDRIDWVQTSSLKHMIIEHRMVLANGSSSESQTRLDTTLSLKDLSVAEFSRKLLFEFSDISLETYITVGAILFVLIFPPLAIGAASLLSGEIVAAATLEISILAVEAEGVIGSTVGPVTAATAAILETGAILETELATEEIGNVGTRILETPEAAANRLKTEKLMADFKKRESAVHIWGDTTMVVNFDNGAANNDTTAAAA